MKKRLLLVDDAPIIRMMLRNILEYHGFEVVGEASNGAEAIIKYRELKPDLITMDIIMPEKDGIQALEELMQIDRNIKVIMVTAIDQRESLMKAIRLGATDYIVKPFEEERVLSAVQKAVA